MPTGVYKRTKKTRKSLSVSRLGISPWNKGKKWDRIRYPNAGHFTKHSDISKIKMRNNHRGMRGKRHLPETIHKISESQKGIPRPRGEESAHWNGGQRKYFVKAVLDRDNYTCKHCHLRDDEIMQVDHVLERSLGGNNNLDNLQTLCPNCHARKTIRFLRSRSAGK